MTGSVAPAIAPGRAILINEVSVAAGGPARRIDRLIDDAVLECFPTLSREDLEAATLYARVYPMTGRPRKRPFSNVHPNLRAVSEKRAPSPVVPR